jgi:hypothetical protein
MSFYLLLHKNCFVLQGDEFSQFKAKKWLENWIFINKILWKIAKISELLTNKLN